MKDRCKKEPVQGTGHRLRGFEGDGIGRAIALGGLAQRLALGEPFVVTAGVRS